MSTGHACRWLLGLSLAISCIPGYASAQEGTQRNQAALLGAPVEFQCGADRNQIRPTGFFLALHHGHPDSIRGRPDAQSGDSSGSLETHIVVYVWVNGAAMPLKLISRGQSAPAYTI